MPIQLNFLFKYFVLFTAIILLGACARAYYGTMEKMGVHKRDILVHRVEKARDSQEQAKEQFKTALQKFSELTNFDGGDLEAAYNSLNSEFEESKERADDIRKRIEDVEDVAEALFVEWEQDLEKYSSASLRRSSKTKLSATRSRYKQLLRAMKQAERKIDPVLQAFEDQVLYLKHNLNAKAIASLKTEVGEIKDEVARLIQDMEKSISKANEFISQWEGSENN